MTALIAANPRNTWKYWPRVRVRIEKVIYGGDERRTEHDTEHRAAAPEEEHAADGASDDRL